MTEEEATASLVNEAGFRRNEAMQEVLNIYLEYTVSNTDPNSNGDAGDVQALRNLQFAGKNYDFVLTGATVAGTLAQEDFYADLNNSQYVHADAYYYEAQVNDQVKIGDKQYFASGYYSVMNTAAIDVTYVNMDIVSAYNHMTKAELYQLVLENNWTIERLLTMGALYATPDTNTGNVLTDHYGLILSNNYCQNMYFDLGGTTVERDDDGEYSITVNSTENMELLLWIRNNLTKNSDVKLVANDRHFDSFLAGGAPFCCVSLYNIFRVLESDMTCVMLPSPLKNEGDDYKAYSDSWCLNFAGIPAFTSDFDKAGYLYEVFMCFSYEYVYPAYYEQNFQIRYQPDDVGSRIFDIVASSRVVDLPNIYGWYGTTNIQTIVRSSDLGIASSTTLIRNDIKSYLNQ